MSITRGVVMIMYDLPVQTATERKYAEQFRKFLKKNGYVSLQKSIYVKLLRDMVKVNQEHAAIKKASPKSGIIQILPMTINQFQNMLTITGEKFNIEFFSNDVIFI